MWRPPTSFVSAPNVVALESSAVLVRVEPKHNRARDETARVTQRIASNPNDSSEPVSYHLCKKKMHDLTELALETGRSKHTESEEAGQRNQNVRRGNVQQ